MAFIDVISIADNIPVPVRAYVHEAGFEEVYDGSVEMARAYLESFMKDSLNWYSGKEIRGFDYILGAVWGKKDKDEKIIDLFGFSDINEWPGNPDVTSFVIKNGSYDADENYDSTLKSYTCGDTLIMLGEEEAYRRTTKNLEEYFRNPPSISVMRTLEK